MKSRTRTALGIDIGDRHVSAALVEKAEKGFRVVASARGSLREDEPGAESPSCEKTICRVLRKLGRRAGTRGTRSAVAISTRSVIRLLDLPRQMPANVGEFVDNELRQYVALSGRTVASDFCGMGMGCGSRKRLLAVAADAAEVGEIIKTCRQAGVVAESVEPAALACARAFLMGEKGLQHGGHALVGVLGGSSLTVCLFGTGLLDFVRIRDIPAGMNTPGLLCTWLAEELNAVLRYGCAEDPRGSSAWQTRLVIHDAAYSRDEIAPLLALGPGSASVTVVDCCGDVAAAPESSPGPSMMAVGAALRLLDMEGDPLRIDLMPQEVVEARSSSRRVLIMANLAAILFLGIFLTVQLLAKTTEAMSRRIEQTRVDELLGTMPAVVARDRYLDEEITRIERQLAGLEAVCARHEVEWPAVLTRIGQAVPAGACVTSLAWGDGQSLSVRGSAPSAEEAKAFVQDLAGRELFDSVRLTRIQRSQAGADVVEYEVECMLKPVIQESGGGHGA